MNMKLSHIHVDLAETAMQESSAVHSANDLNIDSQTFRQGMSNLAAAVNVITTHGEAGRAGFTASAVCSVTDSPPTLLVCLNRSASVFETFKANQVLCVNTLPSEHQHLSNVFGGKTPMSERFNHGQWTTLATQSPVLEDALVSFDCEIVESMSIGSHDVLICQVKAMKKNLGQKALMYFNRTYCEPVEMYKL